MNSLAILALGFAPGIFWLWYFYRRDKLEPEPKHLVIRTFFWGMLSAVLAALVELPFQGVILSVIAAPVIEEYVKYFVVRRTIYNHAEFDEPMDGIVYAASAALGFASAENAAYLFSANLSPDYLLNSPEAVSASDAVLTVFILRALLSVPAHVLFSSMWGYALGRAKFTRKERRRRIIVWGLLLAMFWHGLFNFVVLAGPALSLGMLTLLGAGWWLVRRKILDARASSPHGFSG